MTSDHVPPEALVARGRGEARKDTGNRPRLAGRRGGAPGATSCSGGGAAAPTRGGRWKQLPTRGGRYFKYRPPPWVLTAVGWSTCGPDHVRFQQPGTPSVVLVGRLQRAARRWRPDGVARGGGSAQPWWRVHADRRRRTAGGLAASLLKRSSPDELWATRPSPCRPPPGKDDRLRQTRSLDMQISSCNSVNRDLQGALHQLERSSPRNVILYLLPALPR